MSKGNSGHFKGANGKNSGGGGGSAPSLFDNGHITLKGVKAHREEFMGKSVEQIAEMLKQNGYEVKIRDSNRKSRGSKAQIIEITNTSKNRNITQVQVSPKENIHGLPYVKISVQNQRKIKVIDGKEENYKNGKDEKSHLIFRRDD